MVKSYGASEGRRWHWPWAGWCWSRPDVQRAWDQRRGQQAEVGEGPYKSNRQAGFKGEGWETRQDVEVEQDNGQHQGLRVGRDLGPKMEIKRVTRVFGPRRKTTAKQGPDPWGFRHSKWFA